ncbi:MAG TPA: MFS transporter [Acidimicrobiales bacterium]|nr:MFS transporter [Acidimicrobiales bacterium]
MGLTKTPRSPRAAAADENMKAWSLAAFNSTYLPALILAMGTGIAIPAIPAIARSFHVGFALATGVTTSFLIGNVAGALPSGWLIDRYGRRRIMLLGPILTALMAFAVVLARTYPQLLALRFADGFATQLWMMGRITGISHSSSPDQRGRQISWLFGMDNSGRALGPLIGGLMATSWGIRSPFIAYGVLSLLALIPAYRYIGDTPRKNPVKAKDGAGPNLRSARPLTYRQLVSTYANYFAIALFGAFSRGPIQAGLLNIYAAFRYHMNPSEIGYLAAASAAIMLPVGFITGWVMDRYGRRRTMIPGYTGVCLTMVGLALIAFFNLSTVDYVVVFLIASLCQGITNGAVQTIGADVAPREVRGKFLGLWRFTGQGGVALSPLIFAALAAAVSYGASFLFVGGSAAAVTLLVYFKMPDTRSSEAILATAQPRNGPPMAPDVSVPTTAPDLRSPGADAN